MGCYTRDLGVARIVIRVSSLSHGLKVFTERQLMSGELGNGVLHSVRGDLRAGGLRHSNKSTKFLGSSSCC